MTVINSNLKNLMPNMTTPVHSAPGWCSMTLASLRVGKSSTCRNLGVRSSLLGFDRCCLTTSLLVMGEGVLLPTGKILIINGGRTGTAGYSNLQYRIGDSNCDNPVYTPILYDPAAPAGSRFSRANLPTSNIGRLYHSTAYVLCPATFGDNVLN